MKTKTFISSSILIIATNLYAQTEISTVDPGDLTKVKTQGQIGTYTQEGEYGYKLMGSIGGSYNSGSQFMGMVEADFYNGDYSNLRAQYFQVFETTNEILPNLGFSIDYIKPHGLDLDLKAIGAIARVKSPWNNVLLFPNIAYVNSEVGKDIYHGYQLNLYSSIYLGTDGRYLMPHIGYTDIDYMKYIELDAVYGQPLSANRRVWGIARVDKSFNIKNYNDDLRFTLGLNYFF